MSTYQLDGVMFSKMVSAGASNLKNNASVVNDLNVFPIPDGDTGDNMSSTICGGVSAIVPQETKISKASKSIADGMLFGARGNSGVILSQFFAGIAEHLSNFDTVDISEFGKACVSGVKQAYKSVNTPTEGTILTVVREASDYAVSHTDGKENFEAFMENFKKGAEESLEHTPEKLAVLKEAGVVDSGGAGLVYIVDGMRAALEGKEIFSETLQSTQKQIDISGFDENSVLEFGYCTEFLLRLQNVKTNIETFDLEEMKKYLESIGNSIVAIQNGSVVKVHVHTMKPGDVIAHCQMYGEFLTLKIENMSLQHSESIVENRYSPKKDDAKKHVHCAVVAVASGEGIKEIFSDYGADIIIDGGQSMNPSSQDFIDAFEKLDADIIVVLPNNSNVILSAQQAAKLYDKAEIIVLDTKNIGEGHSALTMMDKDSDDIKSMLEDVRENYKNSITGMVCKAIRNTDMSGIEIKSGDYIGFINKTIISSDDKKINAAKAVIDNVSLDERDILIIIKGRETSDEENEAVAEYAKAKYSDKEIYEIDGGQEIYDFIFVSE